MSEDMRQELNDLKTTVDGIVTTLDGHTRELSDLKTAVGGLTDTVAGLTDIVAGHTQEIKEVKKTVRNIAITVAGHTETLFRMEKQLSKLDTLDVIVKNLEVFTAEIIASRHERTLMGKSFFDQQETLTDHELRLTKLEPRDKQS